MVDMVLIRQERVLSVAYPMQINPDHITARNQQRGECQHHRIYMYRIIICPTHSQLETEKTEHHANGQAACVTHENLFSVLGIPENIVIKERH